MKVNFNGGRVLIRDSKYLRDPANDPALEPTISTTAVEWMSFLDQVMDPSIACSALSVVSELLPVSVLTTVSFFRCSDRAVTSRRAARHDGPSRATDHAPTPRPFCQKSS